MKLKFSAEPEDIRKFVIYALILLYMIAIVVLNFSSLANTGKFWGFNPFPAFVGEFLAPTMVFFCIALLAIIAMPQSKFFDREKGLGFKTGKANKGYSKWAKKPEMKSVLKRIYASDETFEYGGIPIITDGDEIWVDDGESHNLIIGTTGSGKTRRVVHEMVKILGKKGESIIVTDPKGEIYDENAALLQSRGYKLIVLNLRNPSQGNAWNPLTLPYRLYQSGDKDKANEILDDLALNILYDEENKGGDPFWEKTSADYFSGLALSLFEDAEESQVNLNSINLMTTVGEEPYAGSTYIKEYFRDKDPSKPAYMNVSSTLMAPADTKNSILSVFKQKIRLFSARENLSEMLSYSDFDMKDIGREKTAVFIIIQDEKKTYHPLATIFVKQCYETLIDVAQGNGGKLPVRTNFLLDEFANMPPLKDVTTMITAARSRQIRFTMIIQNFAQLDQVYGKENSETIRGNCSNTLYLLSSELRALEEMSKLCGEVKEKDGKGTKPLITVNELQRLKMGDVIINKHRQNPFKTKFPDLSKYDFGDKNLPKPGLPQRERREVALFDIRKYVQEKRNKAFEILSNDAPRPMGGPMAGFGGGPMPNMMGPTDDGMPDFDVDDLVKRIDAKIAALEEEERREKEAQKAQKNQEQVMEPEVTKPVLEPQVKPKIEPKVEPTIPMEQQEVPDLMDLESLFQLSLPEEDTESGNHVNKFIPPMEEKVEPSSPTKPRMVEEKAIEQLLKPDIKPMDVKPPMAPDEIDQPKKQPTDPSFFSQTSVNSANTKNVRPGLEVKKDLEEIETDDEVTNDQFFDDFFFDD